MNLSLIDHIAVNIKDLEKSAEWYRNILGFKVIHKWKTTWMIGKGNIRVGLFERPSATVIEDLDNKVAITHFAFLVDKEGFEAAQSELKEKGVVFDPVDDSGIAYSIFFKDPDEHLIEITTYHE